MGKLKAFFSSRKSPFGSNHELVSYFSSQFGVKPKNIKLYEKALTHKSISSESNNERLEYLGDTILSSAVATYLFKNYPKKNEGELTILVSKLVTRKKLNEIGELIKLNDHITAISFEKGYKNLVGNAYEAVIGAIYLDLGFETTQQAVYISLLRHVDIKKLDEEKANFKSVLIVWGQKTGNKVEFKGKKLLESNKYKSTLFINGKKINSTASKSKKEAEVELSEKALKSLFSDEY